MVELNPTFAAHLRNAFKEKPSFRTPPRAAISSKDRVQELGPARQTADKFDLVISGLPLNNFSSENVHAILAGLLETA